MPRFLQWFGLNGWNIIHSVYLLSTLHTPKKGEGRERKRGKCGVHEAHGHKCDSMLICTHYQNAFNDQISKNKLTVFEILHRIAAKQWIHKSKPHPHVSLLSFPKIIIIHHNYVHSFYCLHFRNIVFHYFTFYCHNYFFVRLLLFTFYNHFPMTFIFHPYFQKLFSSTPNQKLLFILVSQYIQNKGFLWRLFMFCLKIGDMELMNCIMKWNVSFYK